MILKLPCHDFGNFLFFLPTWFGLFWSWSHGFSLWRCRWRPCILILTRCAVLEFVKAAILSRQRQAGDRCQFVGVACRPRCFADSWRRFDREGLRNSWKFKRKCWSEQSHLEVLRGKKDVIQKHGSLWVSVWSKKTIVGLSTVFGGLEENIKVKEQGKQPTIFYDF